MYNYNHLIKILFEKHGWTQCPLVETQETQEEQ